MTTAIEQDVRAGRAHTIAAAANLFGLRADGQIYFQAGEIVRWEDFERAARAGLYDGDIAQIVFYDYGTAGGYAFDFAPDLVQWLADAGGIVGGLVSAQAGSRIFTQSRRNEIGDDCRTGEAAVIRAPACGA